MQNPPPRLHYKICRLTLFKQLCREVSADCISDQCVQEVDARLNQQEGCMPICLGPGTPLLQARWGCCKAISRDWQSQKRAKAFEKAKQNASLFFPPLITPAMPKFIPTFSLGLYFFQVMHVTVTNYGCSRNKSCGLIGSAVKWGKSVGRGKLWAVVE